jgi:hypothetical protein
MKKLVLIGILAVGSMSFACELSGQINNAKVKSIVAKSESACLISLEKDQGVFQASHACDLDAIKEGRAAEVDQDYLDDQMVMQSNITISLDKTGNCSLQAGQTVSGVIVKTGDQLVLK